MKQPMLKAVLSVMALAMTLYTLTGCRHTTGNSSSAQPISNPRNGSSITLAPKPGPITVKAHGGMIIVRTATGIEILSPWDGAHIMDDGNGLDVPARDGSCNVTIEIEIQGLASPKDSTIDVAFNDVRVRMPGWRRMGDIPKYFVIVKLASWPASIRPEQDAPSGRALVSFEKDPGNPAPEPEGAILTFDSPDQDNVTVKRTQTRNCDNPQNNTRTETVEKLKGNTLFLGIGLPYGFSGDKENHAKEYFNGKLLCEAYGSCNAVPKERKIFSTRHLQQQVRQQRRSPQLTYAAFTDASLTMLAVENCALPPFIVTTQ